MGPGKTLGNGPFGPDSLDAYLPLAFSPINQHLYVSKLESHFRICLHNAAI